MAEVNPRKGTVEALLFPEVSEYKGDLEAAIGTFLGMFSPLELVTQSVMEPNKLPMEVQAACNEANFGLFDYVATNVQRLSIEVEYTAKQAREEGDAVMGLVAGGPGGDVFVYPLDILVYKLSTDGPADEMDDAGEFASASHWMLPAAEFDGMWESLIYDSSIKSQLVRYVQVAMQLSDAGVNPNLVAFNRVVLLHGPPGTGKTSLCKALAHKLAIRLSSRYRYGQLIEINAHSLFSKWFSESGKLVTKLFTMIRELVEDQDTFVVVLIDEVESLTAARTSAMSGAEPSDSIRVVNALLTQLDQISSHPNVAILTTSNITGAIDLAFVDRADIKQYIGLPSHEARYGILSSAIADLFRTGVVAPPADASASGPFFLPFEDASEQDGNQAAQGVAGVSASLVASSLLADGLSGRSLRKIPFGALVTLVSPTGHAVSAASFMAATEAAIQAELVARADLSR